MQQRTEGTNKRKQNENKNNGKYQRQGQKANSGAFQHSVAVTKTETTETTTCRTVNVRENCANRWQMAPFLLRRQYFDVFAKIMTICENSVEVADIKNKNNNTIPFNSQQVAVVQQTQQVADEQHAIRDQLTSSPLKSEGVVQIVSTSMERFKFIDSSSEESEAEDGK